MSANTDLDRRMLERTMALARDSLASGYSPVGAVLVDEAGRIIASSQSHRVPGDICHAEFLALLEFQLTKRQPNPGNLTLYVTLEPCIMCLGMATVSRIGRIMWLVDDHWGGAAQTYRLDSPYMQRRLPVLERASFDDLRREAVGLWAKYLGDTDPPFVSIVLGEQVAA
jgi:tRNA(adenine34) deaminase